MNPSRRLTLAVALACSTAVFADTLTFVNRSADVERRLTLRRDGATIAIVDQRTQRIVASAPAATTDRVLIAGAAGAHRDTLTIDLGEPLALRGGIDYDGGAGGWDELVLRGGNAAHQRVTQLTPHDGVIELDELVVRYTNLEPITDTGAAATFTIVGTAGPDTVTVADGPGNTTTVSSPTFESVTFANKTNVVFDGLGGGDTVTFNNPTPATGLTSFVVTNVATVTQTGAINYASLGVNATGAVDLNDVVNDVDRLEATTVSGNIDFRDVDGVTVGGVSATLAGLRVTTAGSINLRAADILLDDTDGAEIVRSGSASGNVALTATGTPAAAISVAVDRDAVLAPAGNVDMNANAIALGTGGATFSNDVRAAGTVNLEAASQVVVAGASRVASDDFGTNSGAALNVRGFDLVEVRDTAVLGAAGNAGADAIILTGGNGDLILTSANPAALFSTSGDVAITTWVIDVDPASGITASAGKISVATFIFGTFIILGPTTDVSNLGPEISDAELDRFFAPRVELLAIANIQVTQPITFTTGTELFLQTEFGSYQGSGTGSLSGNTIIFAPLYSPPNWTWTITTSSILAQPNGTPIPFTNVGTLRIISTGGSDTFLVAPHPTTIIEVDGNSPAPPASPGDTLDFDLTGVTNPVLTAILTPTGYQGSLTSSNRAPVNFSDIETLVDAPVDLQIAKTDNATTDVAGTTVTYTITVTNPAPIPVIGARVTDAFPAELSNVTWTCAPGAGSSCTNAGAGDLDQNVTLGANSSVTYTVTATISPAATATLANTANVQTPAGYVETNPSNNTSTDTTTLTAEADLQLTKDQSGAVAVPGGNVTYTITLRNGGPSDAQSVTLTDVLPAGTTFVSLAAPPSYGCTTPAVGANGTVTCTIATLPPSATPDAFTLIVRIADGTVPGTVIANTATATSTTTDTTANTATATITVSANLAGIPTLSTTMMLLLAATLALGAMTVLRRV